MADPDKQLAVAEASAKWMPVVGVVMIASAILKMLGFFSVGLIPPVLQLVLGLGLIGYGVFSHMKASRMQEEQLREKNANREGYKPTY